MKTLDSARVRGGRGVKRRGPPIAGAGGGQTMEQGQATLHPPPNTSHAAAAAAHEIDK